MLDRLRDIPETVWVNFALAAIFLGAALALLGYIAPWSECPEKEAGGRCPLGGREIAGIVAGIVVMLGGLTGTGYLFGWHQRLFRRG
ncbi:hypothetical protein [Micrococcoides hystricis]|uniref:Uncharacterized protein n=1 Tax=Micrococcoides hystricis TaxID=1572761 RepID=A0ABV6PD54_9MICC